MTTSHALLSPSAAERWMACPPSVRFCEEIAPRSSEAADEGTLAHRLAEVKLRIALEGIPGDYSHVEAFEEVEAHPLYGGEEMERYVDEYVEYCLSLVTPDSVWWIETAVSIDWLYPAGSEAQELGPRWGTRDFCTFDYQSGALHVVDLKYGKGVRKDAPGNPQLRIYAYGTLLEMRDLYPMFPVGSVTTHIVQPRLEHVSTETFIQVDELSRVDIPSIADLHQWVETEVIPAAQQAWEGAGEFTPGEEQCRFCPGRAQCRAHSERALSVMQAEFTHPNELPVSRLAELLDIAPVVQSWAESLRRHATDLLARGQPVPGWKLVEGRSVRQITDPEEVLRTLENQGYAREALVKPPSLRGLGELEKAVGKKRFAELCAPWIIRPPGSPTLVREDDPREDLNIVETDFKEFKEDE